MEALQVEPALTPRAARVGDIMVYAVALLAWVAVVGLPKSTFLAFTWIWLATIAWNNQAPWRTHLAFPRDWWLPLAVLTAYLYSRGLADDPFSAEAANGTVERSGFELDPPTGVLENILHDSVSVPLLRGEHQQDEEVDGAEGQVILWGCHGVEALRL